MAELAEELREERIATDLAAATRDRETAQRERELEEGTGGKQEENN